MSEFITVLGAVIPVFAIAGIGLFLRKINWLTEEADQSLLRVSINILYPCLILDAALGNSALSRLSNLVLAPLVGFGTVVLGYLLARLAHPLHLLKEPRETRTFILTVGLYNYTYVPLPLALLLFSGNETVGVLFVHNVGVEVAMWTIGVMLLSGARGERAWGKIVNAPLLAIIVALLINAFGGAAYVPNVGRTILHWLGQCAVPMALILIGAIVADHLRECHAAWGWRVVGSAVALRIVVLPMLFLLVARYLPASTELKRVVVLEAAMPSAVFPIVMSRHYGGDPATALRVVIGTSVVGLLTIPLWIRFGLKFVGL